MRSDCLRRMFLALLPVLVVAGALSALASSAEDECDMSRIEKGFYCESCDRILEKSDLVSDAEYYACPDCGAVYPKAGKCPDCETALEKKKSGKNACKTCYEKAKDVEVCVKVYYECPECKATSASPGKCAHCVDDSEKPIALKEVVSRALIEYTCEECGEFSYKPGKCTDKECANYGKPYVKHCSMSGTFPHVKAKPAKE